MLASAARQRLAFDTPRVASTERENTLAGHLPTPQEHFKLQVSKQAFGHDSVVSLYLFLHPLAETLHICMSVVWVCAAVCGARYQQRRDSRAFC